MNALKFKEDLLKSMNFYSKVAFFCTSLKEVIVNYHMACSDPVQISINVWSCSRFLVQFFKPGLAHSANTRIMYVMLVLDKAKGPTCCCPSARNIKPESWRMQEGEDRRKSREGRKK